MEKQKILGWVMVGLQYGGVLKWLRGQFAKLLGCNSCVGSNPTSSAKTMGGYRSGYNGADLKSVVAWKHAPWVRILHRPPITYQKCSRITHKDLGNL